MKRMKQWMHWVLALVLLMMSLSVPTAAAETITVNVTNTPVRGSVALEKTGLQLVRFTDEQDEWGNTVMKPVYQQGYLKGAVFELRAAADVAGKEGTVFYKQGELVETLTTSADGAVNSKPLPLGSYCLQEVSAPDGYLLDDTPYPFTLTAAGKQTAVVEVKVSAVNTYLPIRVTLHKQQEAIRVDETAGGMIRSSIETVPGEGCVFGLFNAGVIAYGDSQKLPAHTLMATGITDAKGNLTFSGMYPHGAYYVKELSAPDGWLLNTEQYPVLLTPENMDAAEEAIVITLDAPILNRLIYLCRSRYARVSKAEIKYIFRSVNRAKAIAFLEHHTDCRIVFYIWFHFFCYHFMSLLFCLFLIKISLLFRLIFSKYNPSYKSQYQQTHKHPHGQHNRSLRAEHIIISFQINHNYNRRNHI